MIASDIYPLTDAPMTPLTDKRWKNIGKIEHFGAKFVFLYFIFVLIFAKSILVFSSVESIEIVELFIILWLLLVVLSWNPSASVWVVSYNLLVIVIKSQVIFYCKDSNYFAKNCDL